MNLTDIAGMVWPLVVVLMLLLIMRQLRDDVNPIFKSVVGGLSQDAGRNAKQYAIAIGFGLSASLSAFVDVFKELDAATIGTLGWHQYAAAWAKVANPFVVAVLAYATQSNFKPGNSAGTNPPFAGTPPQPLT